MVLPDNFKVRTEDYIVANKVQTILLKLGCIWLDTGYDIIYNNMFGINVKSKVMTYSITEEVFLNEKRYELSLNDLYRHLGSSLNKYYITGAIYNE